MKKLKIITVSIILSILILAGVVYAADYYRSNHGTYINIDMHDECREIQNTSSVDYFVPTKTSTEWTTFISNSPSWITIPNECLIDEYQSSPGNWWHTKWTHIMLCIHDVCHDWYNSSDASATYLDSSRSHHNRPVRRWRLRRTSYSNGASSVKRYNSSGSYLYTQTRNITEGRRYYYYIKY